MKEQVQYIKIVFHKDEDCVTWEKYIRLDHILELSIGYDTVNVIHPHDPMHWRSFRGVSNIDEVRRQISMHVKLDNSI